MLVNTKNLITILILLTVSLQVYAGILNHKPYYCNYHEGIFNNANLYGASYLESQTVSMSNTSVVGSLVSKYSLVMDGASSITKGNLPDIFGTNIGFNPSVLPGSHLEY